MFAPLVSIRIPSIYGGDLPARLAKCTPDMLAGVLGVVAELNGTDDQLVLSDMYRTYDMQFQAHLDYVTGKKRAFSPPPGGSMHEAGRAFDLDLDKIRTMGLAAFWTVGKKHGLNPIIDKPLTSKSEAWHFDCRGSHDLVYRYYQTGLGDNFESPYTAMAASAIVSTGQKVDKLGSDPRPSHIQSGLIRLGQKPGDLDGQIGPKTRAALVTIGIDPGQDLAAIAERIDHELQAKFPAEYFIEGLVPEPSVVGEFPVGVSAAETAAPAPGAYKPNPQSLGLLGQITNSLAAAQRITQIFANPPRFLAVLPGGELYLDSDLELDTDGWPGGAQTGEDTWNPDTSLHTQDGTAIDANSVPYIVLPLPTGWSQQFGISLGDYAAVIFRDRLCCAVFADLGPKNRIGEGSLALLRALGAERLRTDGTVINAGMGPGVITIVFPGSGDRSHRRDEATLRQHIDAVGRTCLEKIA
jgi:hypothetical protein